jgi:hypothetical protein
MTKRRRLTIEQLARLHEVSTSVEDDQEVSTRRGRQ